MSSNGPLTEVGALVKKPGASGSLTATPRARAFLDVTQVIAADTEHILGRPRDRRVPADVAGGVRLAARPGTAGANQVDETAGQRDDTVPLEDPEPRRGIAGR
jgi:hypothetical protein